MRASELGKRGPAALLPRAVRVLAFYLSQVNPIPENERRQPPCPTEWTNAARTSPLLGGNVQLHRAVRELVPDRGFLRVLVREGT
jgi:hypothetical protein